MEVVRAGQNVRIASLCCPQKLRGLILSGNIVESLQEIKVVARGKVSDVILCADVVTGQKYIIKRYYKQRLSKLRSFQCIREVKLHCALSHPNIVTIYGAFEDSQTVNLLLEHAPQGDLYKAIMSKGAPEKVAAKCVAHILDALMYLHERNVIHRDIKLENVLSCETGYKLADFGLSINAADERPVTKLGTGEYMSPEVLRCLTKSDPSDHKDREDLKYGPEVDVWALGVLSFEMLTGQSPFKSQETSLMLQEMEKGPAFPPTLPADACSFVRDALTLDPVARPSASDLMAHPWLRKFNLKGTRAAANGGSLGPRELTRRGSLGVAAAQAAGLGSGRDAPSPIQSVGMASSPTRGVGVAAAPDSVAPSPPSYSRAKSFSHIRINGSKGPDAKDAPLVSLPHGHVRASPSSSAMHPQVHHTPAADLASHLHNTSFGFSQRAKMFQSAELPFISNLDGITGAKSAGAPRVPSMKARGSGESVDIDTTAASPRLDIHRPERARTVKFK